MFSSMIITSHVCQRCLGGVVDRRGLAEDAAAVVEIIDHDVIVRGSESEQC